MSQNTSLDGVMQSPGPADVPFRYRGWTVDFDGSREGARFNYEEEVGLEEAQNSEALLVESRPLGGGVVSVMYAPAATDG